MKRKDKSSSFDTLRHRFPPIRLYRSDIDEVIEMAQARSLNIKISDDDYVYESIDEIEEHRGSRVYKLNIEVSKNNATIKTLDIYIEKDGVTLRTYREDQLVPLWHEVKELFSKRMPWYARLMAPFSWAWAAIVWLWVGPRYDEISSLPQSMLLVWFGAFTFFVLAGLLSAYYRVSNRGIYLQKQHEVKGFWERNGDKILMLVMGSVLGVIGTIITNILTSQCP